jgi:serine/threonine protein kinase
MPERIITDTTNFFSIERGDVIAIDGRYYRVTGHERERRFGVEDPKFWVKRVIDSETGEKKIVKLSYFENFNISIGGMKIACFRNPEKEAKILDLVKSHPHFMQGKAYRDSKGNIMRLLDPVLGSNFLLYIDTLKMGHETYFHTTLPVILKEILKAFEGIRFLHEQGYKHGDIRNDHIIVEQGTGNYVWIDFDYDFITEENPYGMDLLGLGNILLYAIGKGFHNRRMIRDNKEIYGDLINRIEDRDFSIVNKRRFMNLRKLYPYVPISLNNILAHFAIGAEIFYESVDEILDDLGKSIDSDLK